ncbi:hypothetical protein PG994_014867 [Apiospora phragmitis]|uniref:Uncharacterized protein n=1 Tax=Apiospora phragmitis TaxID=2905665 RepID=A0ABR1SUU7_9PEZI
MDPSQLYRQSDKVAANGFSSLEEVSSPGSASALGEKKRKLARDDSGLSDVKRQKVDDRANDFLSLADAKAKTEAEAQTERLLPGYIAELQKWRDNMPVEAVRNQLPLNWHVKSLLEVLLICPALLDLWMEAVASGDQLFESASGCPFRYLLPDDFKGMTVYEVTAGQPRFEDLITRGIVVGRLITHDPQDEIWIQPVRHAIWKVRAWLSNFPATLDSPYSYWARQRAPSTQEYHDDSVNQEGEQDSVNMISSNFLSLSLRNALTLIPALYEVLEVINIGGLEYGSGEGSDVIRISQPLATQSMGQIMEGSPELRAAQ